jgi:hypothetical protein
VVTVRKMVRQGSKRFAGNRQILSDRSRSFSIFTIVGWTLLNSAGYPQPSKNSACPCEARWVVSDIFPDSEYRSRNRGADPKHGRNNENAKRPTGARLKP